ncbi:hypothetical protein KAW11_01850, partial [Candidatus Bathyarchaeota archaeon]|nr:hypothetical protein [Candidatus Bathyarchaeota archaeon]
NENNSFPYVPSNNIVVFRDYEFHLTSINVECMFKSIGIFSIGRNLEALLSTVEKIRLSNILGLAT